MFELYYGYLEGCRNFNELNDLPEKGWEWHHTLPKAKFGDIRIGLWLTYRQHCIATALQSLAFSECFIFPGQLAELPPTLYEMARKLVSDRSRKTGLKVGRDNVDTQRGIWDTRFDENRANWRRKGGETTGPRNQLLLGKKVVATINSEVFVFPSVAIASKVTGICTSNISKVCKGKRKTAGGITFAYLD